MEIFQFGDSDVILRYSLFIFSDLFPWILYNEYVSKSEKNHPKPSMYYFIIAVSGNWWAGGGMEFVGEAVDTWDLQIGMKQHLLTTETFQPSS